METNKTKGRVPDQTKGKIVCNVQNCAFHQGECNCTAKQIAVGPTYAPSGKDTVCATFKPKEL